MKVFVICYTGTPMAVRWTAKSASEFVLSSAVEDQWRYSIYPVILDDLLTPLVETQQVGGVLHFEPHDFGHETIHAVADALRAIDSRATPHQQWVALAEILIALLIWNHKIQGGNLLSRMFELLTGRYDWTDTPLLETEEIPKVIAKAWKLSPNR